MTKMNKILYKKHKLIGNKGFSLVELIIVIAIMAVLMAVLAPQLIKYVEKSRTQADETAASEILNAANVAISNDAIYTALVTLDTVVWDAGAGTITNTGLSTIANDVKTVINPVPTAKSQTHKAGGAADVYTITITINAGVVTTAGLWS